MTAEMLPDYTRQIALKEIGEQGQARLARSRVLVIGAGGLGSPVLQYLAGAGVGCIGIIDHDLLDSSNLHRQPLYSLADVGRPKAALAAEALVRLNPRVRVETHPVRFDAGNAVELVSRFDASVDCSDNFRTKFLVNDAAVIAGRPAVFASVYQYEGQVQVYKPDDGHACLRCLWPDATADGIVGNCAQAGVLGPVPGALGAMQAILCLKILLGIGGQLDGELWLVNFMNFSTITLKAPRRQECRAPHCARVRAPSQDEYGLELALESLAEARARNYEIIDIRTEEELADRPVGLRHIAMASLLADSTMLSPAARYLLVCASGARSLAAARELRARGLSAHSLAGGLRGLRAPRSAENR